MNVEPSELGIACLAPRAEAVSFRLCLKFESSNLGYHVVDLRVATPRLAHLSRSSNMDNSDHKKIPLEQEIRYIPLSYNSSDSEASALALVKARFPEWDASEIEFIKLTQGITNTVRLIFYTTRAMRLLTYEMAPAS